MSLSNNIYNLLLLSVVWVCVLAGGIYVTYMEQPAELERLEKAQEAIEMEQAEMRALMSEQAETRMMVDDVMARWKARYKEMPDELSSPSVIGYFNEITRRGFENFDVTFRGTQRQGDYDYHTYDVQGRGYFNDLYRVVWQLENNRKMYRVRDVRLDHIDVMKEDEERGTERMQVMVSFRMGVDAYFGGSSVLSAPEESTLAMLEEYALPVSQVADARPPVPAFVLPDERPQMNPFFPGIMDRLPPNTYQLVNVEADELVSIVGDRAVFRSQDGFVSVGEGEDVYLGRLTMVNPMEGIVQARLNKGGIVDDIELELELTDRYRQHRGRGTLRPLNERP